MAKKKKKSLRIGAFVFLLLFVIAGFLAVKYYQRIFNSAVKIDRSDPYVYVETGWSRADLVDHLHESQILKDTNSFNWTANQKSFFTPKPGKYALENGMSNNDLVNLLRSGKQSPVKLTFNTIRTYEDLAGKVANQIEADSISLLKALRNPDLANKYGFSTATFFTLFIPNTYEFYWNTSAEEFIQRMAREYKSFWNESRRAKAKAIGLSQSEVAILASIVQAEQMSHPDERPKVAGLYLNRLKRGMRLQSDPTLVFAIGDFSINRVLNQHKSIQSPYNTYLYSGLPPGPINLPELSSLEAVLNPEQHSYLYMCAKADFSGYHHFSKTLSQHNVYAKEYQRELNRRKIMR
tara:strand:- start:911 stop:1960 length:1050 start_codon:yes stop_codon:yes gene_type:complete